MPVRSSPTVTPRIPIVAMAVTPLLTKAMALSMVLKPMLSFRASLALVRRVPAVQGAVEAVAVAPGLALVVVLWLNGVNAVERATPVLRLALLLTLVRSRTLGTLSASRDLLIKLTYSANMVRGKGGRS